MSKTDMDIISSALLIVVSVVVFFASGGIVAKTNMAVGPDFFPKVVAGLLFVCCSIMLAGAVRKRVVLGGTTKETRRPSSGSLLRDYADWLSLLLIVAYAVSFETLGYLVATTLYIFMQALLLVEHGKKPPVVMIGLAAIVTSGVTYFLFAQVFYLFLPVGLIG